MDGSLGDWNLVGQFPPCLRPMRLSTMLVYRLVMQAPVWVETSFCLQIELVVSNWGEKYHSEELRVWRIQF